MARTDRMVSDLVRMIQNKDLQLPEMQREYVWQATRVRDLLDSLYRGYPSGVILAWETDEDVATTDFAVETSAASSSSKLLLLDGQQRLTSLSAVIRGEPVTVRGRKRPVEILFNLEHPDELTFITEVNESSKDDEDPDTEDASEKDFIERMSRRAFVVANGRIASLPNWVRVTDIFTKSDGDLLRGAGVTSFDDPNYEKYSERLKGVRAIADYSYRMDILEKSKSYEEVTEIFVRVNSLGAKLRSSDLALAQITAKWRGSLQIFQDYQAEVDRRGFVIEMGTYLKTLVALVSGQSKFLVVSGLTTKQLEDGWKRTKKALDFTLNFVQSNIGIDSLTLLSSPFLLVTTAFWVDSREYKIDSTEAEEFRRWFLSANAKGRYSRGSSETLLDQDIAALRNGGPVEGLYQRLIQQMGRLDFTPEDLIGRNSRSGAFKTLFLALRQDGARDWATNLDISTKHGGSSDKIEFHHIFPKAYLKRARPDIDPRDVDDIANLAFIGAATNKKITDRSPEEYKNDFEPHLLKVQLIDFETASTSSDDFEDFKQLRREAIAKRLNQFLA